MELKRPRDYREFGGTIDEYIKALKKMDYGIYRVTEEQRKIFYLLEGMYFLQMDLNKGVRLFADKRETKLEIFDFKKQEEEIDKSLQGFKL